jgi:hypothetical protein
VHWELAWRSGKNLREVAPTRTCTGGGSPASRVTVPAAAPGSSGTRLLLTRSHRDESRSRHDHGVQVSGTLTATVTRDSDRDAAPGTEP